MKTGSRRFQTTKVRRDIIIGVSCLRIQNGACVYRFVFHLFHLEHSASLSSRDDLERRPELLGQSNGENESRVQPDIVRGDISQEDGDDGVGDQDTNHEEPVIVNRQEMLLVDLHEPSSGTHREGSSRDHREESDNARGRTSDDHREGG